MAYKFLEIIDEENVTTFSDFYNTIVKRFPNNKKTIKSVFENDYIVHGKKAGNVFDY